MDYKLPIITVTGELEHSQEYTRNGTQQTFYFQKATIEHDHMKNIIQLPLGKPENVIAVGTKRFWNVINDLEINRFDNVRLSSRQMTFVDLESVSELPVITIKTELNHRQIPSKMGWLRTIYFQRGLIDIPKFRGEIEIPLDNFEEALPVGTTKLWNVMADVRPINYGRYHWGKYHSLTLSRHMSLIKT